MSDEPVGKKLLAKGWRQGTILSVKNLKQDHRDIVIGTRVKADYRNKESRHRLKDTDCFAVLSQDCDISADEKIEPFVEVAVFRPEKKPTDSNSFAQSARNLNLKINDTWFKSNVWLITWIDKKILLDYRPDSHLSPQDTVTLKNWRGLRYIRNAFPDNFDQRVKPVLLTEENIEFFKKYNEVIIGIYIILDTYEEADLYKMGLIALVSKSISDEDFKNILTHMENLIENLDSNDGIEDAHLNDIEFEYDRNIHIKVKGPVYRESEIYVSELSAYRKFNFDYISLSGEGVDLPSPN